MKKDNTSNNIYTIVDGIRRNTLLKTSFAASLVMCLIAHAYSYFNSSLTTDRFRWFNGFITWNIGQEVSGKWFGQYLGFLDWRSYLPWLNGILVVLCISFSVYIVCDALKIKKTLSVWLTAGLFATDVSVIMAHLYRPAGFLYALILACISIWIWNLKDCSNTIRVISGAVFVSLSLATYGAYTSVAPTVVVLACIIMLFEGESFISVIKRGTEYLITFLIGMVLYYAVLRIFLSVKSVEMLSYMGEDNLIRGVSIKDILYYIEIAYKNAIKKYLGMIYEYKAVPQWIAVTMLILGLFLLVFQVVKNKRLRSDKRALVLVGALVLIFPLSAGSIYVMAFGNVHILMIFTFVIFYVGLIKLVESVMVDTAYTGKSRLCVNIAGTAIIVLTFVMIYKGILVSNMCYSRLDNLYEISNGTANRILERIESCEGFEGDEPVYLVGDITDSLYFSRSRYEYSDAINILDGLLAVDKTHANVFMYPEHFIMLLQENTETNLEFSYYSEDDSDVFSAQDHQMIQDMPVFPADGSVRKISGTVVVKFADR